MIKKHKLILIGFIGIVLIASLFVTENPFNYSTQNETDLEELFTFPISVGVKTESD